MFQSSQSGPNPAKDDVISAGNEVPVLRAYLEISQARHGKQSARIWKAGPKTKSATTPLLSFHLKPILLRFQQTVHLVQNLENDASIQYVRHLVVYCLPFFAFD